MRLAFDLSDERIPDVARDKVHRIQELIDAVQLRARDRASAEELAELRQIAEAYVPQLLQSYVDIPQAHRTEIYRQTGRSASYALGDRLDRIVDRLQEIAASLAQGDVDAFHQNMRFIDLRFGRSPFD